MSSALSNAAQNTSATQGSTQVGDKLQDYLTFCVESDSEDDRGEKDSAEGLGKTFGRRKEAARFRRIQESSHGLVSGTVFLDVNSLTRESREVGCLSCLLDCLQNARARRL
jgi:hypothetical protein